MERSETKRIYVDLEYCYPGMTRESGRPGESEQRQVVQIAGIRVDTKTGAEIDAFDVLVHPAYEKELPSFFTELTDITGEMVEKHGISFPEALQKFTAFCDTTPIWTFHNDWNVLRQNCTYFDIPFTFAPFTKVKDLLPEWGIDPARYSSGTLHRAAGIAMQGHIHNALHDVRSMAAAVHFFETKGQE